jgi:hypothetical protein
MRPVRLAYKPATSNQQAVLFSQNKSPSATSHQPNEHVKKLWINYAY